MAQLLLTTTEISVFRKYDNEGTRGENWSIFKKNICPQAMLKSVIAEGTTAENF